MCYWLFRGSRDINQLVDTHGFSLCFGFVTNIAKYLVFPVISDAEECLFESLLAGKHAERFAYYFKYSGCFDRLVSAHFKQAFIADLI